MLAVAPVDPERMGRNGQLLLEGAEATRASAHAPAAPQRRPLRRVQLLPERLPPRRQARDARHLPAARRGGRREGPRRGRGATVGAGAVARRASNASRGRGPHRRPWPRPWSSARAACRDRRRRGLRDARSCCCAQDFGSASGELGRNLRIHPACWVGARFDEEVRGWDGVMQSYAVDEWENRGPAARGDVHPAGVRRHTGCPGAATSTRSDCSSYASIASTGVHLSDSSPGRVGIASRRLAADHLPATARGCRPARVRDRPRRRALLRGGRDGGLSADRRDSDPSASADRRARGVSPSARARCGSRRFTRWAPPGWTPTRRRGVVGTDGAVHGCRAPLRRRRAACSAELDRRQPDDDRSSRWRRGSRARAWRRRSPDSEKAARRRPPHELVFGAAAESVDAAGGGGGGGVARAGGRPVVNDVPSSCIATQPP